MSLGTELWDKTDFIITFNENNTLTVDKVQKFISDHYKTQIQNTLSQKRLIDRFLNENEHFKNSQFNFSSNTYFLTEQVLSVLNVYDIFNNAFLNEVDKNVKSASVLTKKDLRLMKSDNKILSDDLVKENLKLENSLKKYQMNFNAKEIAHNTFLKAEENKALSRNQVDNYHKIFKNKQALYDEAKNEYIAVLNNFNSYQSKHYGTLLKEWGLRAQNIELERYNSLKSTFVNVSEMCKSLSMQMTEIANHIESKIETIDWNQDCLTLINREKTGDVPPGDIPFKDLDIKEKIEIEEPAVSKTSNSSSDSVSSNSGTKQNSIPDISKSIQTSPRHSLGSSNKENKMVPSNTTSGGLGIIGRLFGGSKKSKEIVVGSEDHQSEIEQVQSLNEEKCTKIEDCEITIEFCKDIEPVNETNEYLRNEDLEVNGTSTHSERITDTSTVKRLSGRNSVDENHSGSNMSLFIKRSRGSFRNFLDKRKSRSLSGLTVVEPEQSTVDANTPINVNDKPKHAPEIKSLKPKLSKKPVMRGQSDTDNSRGNVQSRAIEIIGPVCPGGQVEIVSTPAEALAIVARTSTMCSNDQETYADIAADEVTGEDKTVSVNLKPNYDYYYVGSCVAIHEYKSSDPSNIYLSFDIGEQFYIVKEESVNESSGWLLVERIDRSQSGYVPASYMDTRIFDDLVLMHSDHVMLVM